MRELQQRLNSFRGTRLEVDGDFGEQTEQKVQHFQQHRHLGANGIVDAIIWDRIFDNPPRRLHPRNPESRAAQLRRLREEVPVRQRQIRFSDGERRRLLERRLDRVIDKIEDLITPDEPQVHGNRVRGGNPRERIVAAAQAASRLDAAGRRRSFYNQDGDWTADYAITGEPQGYRSDCSQWITAVYRSAGLPDPNGNGYGGGYTGTLASHCRRITRAQLKPGDMVFFGPGWPYEHVELYVGPGEQTIGHGSTHVDGGTIGMMAGASFFTAF